MPTTIIVMANTSNEHECTVEEYYKAKGFMSNDVAGIRNKYAMFDKCQ